MRYTNSLTYLLTFKVKDEFRSGITSSCCGNDVSMELSSVDRCHITFAFELILLKVGVL